MCQIFCCCIIQGISINYHYRNVRSRVSVSNFQVSVSAFMTKARSRHEIWTRLHSRLHHWRKVIKTNIAFCWFSSLSKFFFFDRRFADWPWNVVILLAFQVRVHFFDVIFGICETCRCEMTKIVGRWFWKATKTNIAFTWLSPFSKFFFFDRRFAGWPWNVVILLAFQAPVHFFDVIFGICETCRCEIT